MSAINIVSTLLIGRDKAGKVPHSGKGYGSGGGFKGGQKTAYPLDPSSPFRPITIQEGSLFRQRQARSPVKPIPIQGGTVGAAPRRPVWDGDDGGFGTPGRAKRSLFSDKNTDSNGRDRGRSRMRGHRNKEADHRAKSLNTRQTSGSEDSGARGRQRPTSLDRSLKAKQRHSFHEVPDWSDGNREEIGAFEAIDSHPRTPDKSFYGHQPHKYWSSSKRDEQRFGREKARTIAVPSYIDFAQSFKRTVADTGRSKTTGDLSQTPYYDSYLITVALYGQKLFKCDL